MADRARSCADRPDARPSPTAPRSSSSPTTCRTSTSPTGYAVQRVLRDAAGAARRLEARRHVAGQAGPGRRLRARSSGSSPAPTRSTSASRWTPRRADPAALRARDRVRPRPRPRRRRTSPRPTCSRPSSGRRRRHRGARLPLPRLPVHDGRRRRRQHLGRPVRRRHPGARRPASTCGWSAWCWRRTARWWPRRPGRRRSGTRPPPWRGWCARLAADGEGLRAGEVVLSGGLTAAVPVAPGDVVVASIDRLGTVELACR